MTLETIPESGYIAPAAVTAPSARWQLNAVIRDGGAGGYSLALGEWDGEMTVGLRWNGSGEEQPKGNPLSSTHPTWMILPRQLLLGVLGTTWVENLLGRTTGQIDDGALRSAMQRLLPPAVNVLAHQVERGQALLERLPLRN